MAADPLTINTVGEVLNYDISDDDDPFADLARSKPRDDKATLSPRVAKRKADEDKENFGLGLDEEVKITKKRKPAVKLDDARLLTQAGIPKLRTIARSGQLAKKLRLKGRGHEFTDAGRLLNFYQLWLDDLYPRAKFADGLQLVEKAGHSKRMQSMRKEWIDEGKPGYIRDREVQQSRRKYDEPEDRTGKDAPQQTKETHQTSESRKSLFGNGLNNEDMFFPESNKDDAREDHDAPEDDELEALLAERASAPISKPRPTDEDSEGEDDLDALLAEEGLKRRPSESLTNTSKGRGAFEDNENEDEDDLDALLAEQEFSGKPPELAGPASKVADIFGDNQNEDEDDFDALIVEQELRSKTPRSTHALEEKQAEKLLSETHEAEHETELALFSSSPMPNEEINDDELDALLAEHEAIGEQKPDEVQETPSESNSDKLRVTDDSQGKDSGPMFSSSPIPNDEID